MTSGIIKKIDIMIKLVKKVLDKVAKLLSSFRFLFFLLITNPFFIKYFLISKIENFFFTIIIPLLLLLPQVDSGIKDFEHLA
jgi:hypothetical protein